MTSDSNADGSHLNPVYTVKLARRQLHVITCGRGDHLLVKPARQTLHERSTSWLDKLACRASFIV